MEDGSMRTKVLVTCLALAFLAAQPPVALAQDQTAPTIGTWESVRAAAPGERLEVRLKSGKTVKGTFVSASDGGLNLQRGGNATSVNRDDVRQVYRVVAKSSATPALIGAAVGAAVGAGGTAASAVTDDSEGVGAGAALLPLVGAGIGALVGLAFGGRQKRVLIYQSR
jgi:hypothetical protein